MPIVTPGQGAPACRGESARGSRSDNRNVERNIDPLGSRSRGFSPRGGLSGPSSCELASPGTATRRDPHDALLIRSNAPLCRRKIKDVENDLKSLLKKVNELCGIKESGESL